MIYDRVFVLAERRPFFGFWLAVLLSLLLWGAIAVSVIAVL